jgi:amino-acid N-acetyltransferase
MSEERTAPQRIRITGLQESQLPALVELEQACAAMYHEVGFDAAEVPPRSTSELARLPRDHNVHVAEADHEVAGYTAWRDEAPGIAYIAELSVHPDFQRFGIARRLWTALREDASSHAIGAAVVRCWSKAPWAMRFYEHAGFVPIDDTSPEKVRAWRDDKIAGGRPLCRPGEIALWAKLT